MSKFIPFKTNNAADRKSIIQYLDYLDRITAGRQEEFISNIKKNKPVRSIDQNARYWVLITAICNHTGQIKDECHNDYKELFNDGESTKDLDTDEFSIFSKQCQEHAERFHGIVFRDPKDRDYELWSNLVKEDYKKMIRSI